MIVTVFRSRLKPGVESEYAEWAARMSELAMSMPGYVSHKGFVAADGERVTIIEFESEMAQRAWSRHPDHVEAQKKGRAKFYSEYHLQVCRIERESSYPSA
jgi:heme-degrading monooxygenase HmoA